MKKIIIPLLIFPVFLFGDYPFIPNVKISGDSYGIVNHGESSFAVYKDTIYVVCNIAERPIIPMIPFSRSCNRGNTWDLDYAFIDSSTGITWHTDPVVGVDDSGHVHLLVQYYMNFIYHYLSRDGGITWAETTLVSDTSTGGYVDKPWMVVKDSMVFITWQEINGSEEGVRFAASFDYGRTFSIQTIDTLRGLTALNIGEDGTLYLTYVRDSLYYTLSYDFGTTWISPKSLDKIEYSSGVGDRGPNSSIAVSPSGEIFIAWTDIRYGNWDILGVKSYDGGITWTGPYIINDVQQGGQCKCWVTCDPYGHLHLFYYSTPDWPTDTTSLWSVRYAFSPDFGNSFTPSIRITDTVFRGYFYDSRYTFMGDYHMIQADSDFIYAIWTDGRDGDMDLYFSRAALKAISLNEYPTVQRNSISLITTKTPYLLFNLEKDMILTVDLYDAIGRHIKTLASGKFKSGKFVLPINILPQRGKIIFVNVKGDINKTFKLVMFPQ